MEPKEAVIAITYRCNMCCAMCNIWQSPSPDEIEPAHYSKLPSSLKTVNITGGEPFLRKDIVEIVSRIHSRAPSSRIVFSTNGYLTEVITSAISEVRGFHDKVGVGVSIDGPRDMHDAIRGVKGAYDHALSTIGRLKELGLKDLRIGMTLVKENVGEAAEVYRLSKELGVEFTVTFAHNSEIYFRKTDNMPPEFSGTASSSLGKVMKAQLRSHSAKDWFRAYHIQGIMDPDLRKEFVARCEAGSRYFFMSPSGDVYPCMVMNRPIGNLKGVEHWDDLFLGDVEEKTLRAVRGCTEDCWMVCNTRSLIISHPVKAGAWVARNKLRAHLSKE